MSETKPGMPSPALTEDDVRRIATDVFREVMEEYYSTLADRLKAKFKALPQDTSEDQEASEYTQEGWVDESFQDSVTAD